MAGRAAAPTDLGATVGLAQRWQQADEKAKVVVQVLNDKPKEEINTLVQKAMQHLSLIHISEPTRLALI
eukprot:13154456-Alexandrium_andersonii.AAC.1